MKLIIQKLNSGKDWEWSRYMIVVNIITWDFTATEESKWSGTTFEPISTQSAILLPLGFSRSQNTGPCCCITMWHSLTIVLKFTCILVVSSQWSHRHSNTTAYCSHAESKLQAMESWTGEEMRLNLLTCGKEEWKPCTQLGIRHSCIIWAIFEWPVLL